MEGFFAALSWFLLVDSVSQHVHESQRVCDTQVRQKFTVWGEFAWIGAAATSRLPRGTRFQMLSHFWKIRQARRLLLNAQMKTVNGVLRKFSEIRSLLRRGERGKYDSSSSSSSFSRSASSFDQAYSGNATQGGTITPTQEGARKHAPAKPFFLSVLSVTQTFLRVLNNN